MLKYSILFYIKLNKNKNKILNFFLYKYYNILYYKVIK